MAMRLFSLLVVMLLATACGDNFDRDELMNGPQDDGDGPPIFDQGMSFDNAAVTDDDVVPVACGNGTTDNGEACDGDAKECVQINAAYTGGWAECRSDCSGYDTAACLGADDADVVQPDDAVTIPASMTVSATTSTYGGQYAPRNVFAIWLEAADGTYIHSLGVWAQKYKSKLTRWYQKSSGGSSGMTDAVTGASRLSHGTETVSLDFTKYPVRPGNYKVWFELNETNYASKSTSADIAVGPGGTVATTGDTTNIHDIQITFTP